MPELDIIIGGHTHTLLETSKEINNVIIGQTGLKLQYAGLTILKFTKGKLTERSYQSCLIDTITRVDSCITRKVNYFMEQPEFKEVIGISSLPFKSQESIGNIVTDACYVQQYLISPSTTKGAFVFPHFPKETSRWKPFSP